jgi:surface antigen
MRLHLGEEANRDTAVDVADAPEGSSDHWQRAQCARSGKIVAQVDFRGT